VPVLKLPLLAVAVWALGPLFVQVMVSPTCTVIVPGANWKSAIATPGSAVADASARRTTVPLTRPALFRTTLLRGLAVTAAAGSLTTMVKPMRFVAVPADTITLT
jgi:hypothetical protein